MSELIQTIRYASGVEFLEDIAYGGKMYQNLKKGFVYRGLQSGTYKLIPSVLRHKLVMRDATGRVVEDDENTPFDIAQSEYIQKNVEYISLRRFFDICDQNGLRLPPVERIRKTLYTHQDIISFLLTGEDWLPYDLQELAALAQHYGMETRLLDWTSNIETSIYFAVHEEPCLSEEEKKDADAEYVAIWVLNPMVFFGADTSFRIIRPPYYGNPNLAAQKGLFTFWNVKGLQLPLNDKEKDASDIFKLLTNRTPLDELIKEECKKLDRKDVVMWKMLIPSKDRKVLYEYIRRKNVSAASLFPGYEGVVRSLKEDSSFNL